MANNPPQIQLSLGQSHQAFKRSFTQFGLDVDDAEEVRSVGTSDGGSTSASSSSSGSSSSSSTSSTTSTNGSGSGIGYGSHGAVDVFGYNDGERGERNKRARSEGPEREPISAPSSTASNAGSMETASVLSLATTAATSGSVLLDIGPQQQTLPQAQDTAAASSAAAAAASYQHDSNYATSSGYTLPVLDFGPSTPSVAEFVALRSSASGTTTRTMENPPGFANMRSPRSSSPAPPPAVDIDIAMRDDDDDDEDEDEDDDDDDDPIDLLGSRSARRRRQTADPSPTTSSGYLDTARSDAMLNSATERLRSAVERARQFDRILAPLRSDASDGVAAAGGSSTSRSQQHQYQHEQQQQQGYTRPRLPTFDFEARRIHSPFPLRANSGGTSEASNNSNSSTTPINLFDRRSQQLAESGNIGGSTTFERNAGRPCPVARTATPFDTDGGLVDSESGEDDIIVDRELTIDPELNGRRSRSPLTIESLSSTSESNRPLLQDHSPLGLGEGAGRLGVPTRSMDVIALEINGVTGRSGSGRRDEVLGDSSLRSLMSGSDFGSAETGVDPFESMFGFGPGPAELDSRLSVEERNRIAGLSGSNASGRPSTRLQAALSSSRAASASASSGATLQSQSQARPMETHTPTRGLDNFTFGLPRLDRPAASRLSPLLRPASASALGRARASSSLGSRIIDMDDLDPAERGSETVTTSPGRFRGWPWNYLLNPDVASIPGLGGLGGRTNSDVQEQTRLRETQTQTQAQAQTQQGNSTSTSTSPRLQLRPQSPLFPFPILSSPRSDDLSSLSTLGSLEQDNEMRMVQRMVEVDMETARANSEASTDEQVFAPLRRHVQEREREREGASALNHLRSSGVTPASRLGITPGANVRSPQAQTQTPGRQNLPNLRSAVLEPLRDERERERERSEDGLRAFMDMLRRSGEQQSRERERQAMRMDAGAAAGAGARASPPVVSASSAIPVPGPRPRVTHGEHSASRPTPSDASARLREILERRQREHSVLRLGRHDDDGNTTFPPFNPSQTFSSPLRLSRPNAGVPSAPNNNSEWHTRARNLARQTAEELERNRRALQDWFPPILEEDRIREAERRRDAERTMLRELREQQRLAVPTRSSSSSAFWRNNRLGQGQDQGQNQGQERSLPTPTHGRGDDLDLMRWSETLDETFGSSTPDLVGANLTGPTNDYLRGEVHASSDSVSNAATTSTEAAAFFAAGPGSGSARQLPSRSSPAMQRPNRFMFSTGLGEERPHSASRDDLWDDFEMNLDPSDTYGFGRDPNLHRAPPPPSTYHSERGYPSPREDLLQLLFSGRTLREHHDAATQRQANATTTTTSDGLTPAAGRAGPNNESEFADLPALEESHVGTWHIVPDRPQVLRGGRWSTVTDRARRAQDGNSSARPGRSVSLRSASRPPSLPPLQFERLSALTGEGSESTENRLFGSEESSMSTGRPVPWRSRPNARFDGHSESAFGMSSTERNALQRSNDIAMHHAMVLRSVQARQQAMRESEQSSRGGTNTNAPAGQTSGRTQGFQYAMDVLRPDGLSLSLRQRLNNAYERENGRGQGQDRPPPPLPSRNEAHVRWGEIVDDDGDARSTAHSPRPWADTLRARRRSMSALFAPPPENADSLPPNRARGTGTAAAAAGGGGDPHAQASQSPQLDWFSMISSSSSRARARNRARFGRNDDEPPSSRPFLRPVRRTALRNLGDFVRDEDFDTSYESLLALAATLGDVKPRSTPAHVINALPTGLYKDWQNPGCDLRCPICLDDYKDIDPLLKAEPCNHWCHKECFEQWLHTASTCPVCRTKIKPSQRVGTPTPPAPPPVAGPSRLNNINNNNNSRSNENLEEINLLSDSEDEELAAGISSWMRGERERERNDNEYRSIIGMGMGMGTGMNMNPYRRPRSPPRR